MPPRPNPHAHFDMRAQISRRGEHPDLVEDADDRSHLLTAEQRAQREFDQRYANDEAFRERYLRSVGERQTRLPGDIHSEVAGRGYGYGGTPSQGLTEYQDRVRQLARQSHTILESQVASMSGAEFDHYFDEKGVVRPGYRLVLDKALALSDIADRQNRVEYQQAGYLKPIADRALRDADEQASNRAGGFVVDRRGDGVLAPYTPDEAS